MDFKNKIAIVTGASEGIGFGISHSLATKGAKVYLVARTKEKLENARERIREDGGNAEIMPADITDLDSMERLIDKVYTKEQKLDIFVNNAGTWKGQTIGEERESLRKMRALTRDAPTEITEYLINKFKDTSSLLKILTVISQAGLRPMENNLGYGTGKMGLTVNLLQLQKEIEQDKIKNIRLYTLYPATVATPNVLPLIKSGQLENATSLESVVETAIDLLLDKTKTRHAYIGYLPKQGIVRKYFNLEIQDYLLPRQGPIETINPDFDPETDL